jgi:hypothetical protein
MLDVLLTLDCGAGILMTLGKDESVEAVSFGRDSPVGVRP